MDYEEIFNNILNALRVFADAIEDDFKLALRQNGKAGTIDKTFYIDVVQDDRGFTLEINVEDYYKFIENGRRPGTFPPPLAISKWIDKKKIVPRVRKGIRPTKKQLVYLISRSIKEKGIRPLPLLSKAIANNIQEFDIGDALIADIDAKLQEIFAYFGKQN